MVQIFADLGKTAKSRNGKDLFKMNSHCPFRAFGR